MYTNAWEQHYFRNFIYKCGEKNSENLPLQSYSVSNTLGFVKQSEQFKYGGIVSVADKSKSIIVGPHTFAYNPARLDVGSIGYQNLRESVLISPMYEVFRTNESIADDYFLWHWFKSEKFNKIVLSNQEGGVRTCFNLPKLLDTKVLMPSSIKEQAKIGETFNLIDSLITLHQRKQY